MNRVTAIIPVLNEEKALGHVLDAVKKTAVDRIIVVDNGSTDSSASLALSRGAEVLHEPRRGYGSACLKGIEHLSTSPPEIVLFLDGDYSDYPEEASLLIGPIMSGNADLVVGSRTSSSQSSKALLPQARFGNWLACFLINRLYGYKYTDLGPFRAIRWDRLIDLEMADRDWGWTVEMQVKAVKQGIQVMEVPVQYRPRIGQSKISGTVLGSIKAGYKIILTIFKECLK